MKCDANFRMLPRLPFSVHHFYNLSPTSSQDWQFGKPTCWRSRWCSSLTILLDVFRSSFKQQDFFRLVHDETFDSEIHRYSNCIDESSEVVNCEESAAACRAICAFDSDHVNTTIKIRLESRFTLSVCFILGYYRLIRIGLVFHVNLPHVTQS